MASDNKSKIDSVKYEQVNATNRKTEIESPWDKANVFDKWTFRVSNDLLAVGTAKTLQFEDLYPLSHHDVVGSLLPNLLKTFSSSKPIWFIPKLMVALFRAHTVKVLLIIFYTLVESAIRILLPVVLFKLLKELENLKSPIRESYKWAAVLGGLGILQTIVHHILFMLSMRMGWNWRSSTTCLIYDRLFQLNGVALSMFNTGKLVNLISNDVARFEDFTVFSTYSWEALLEVLAILLILIYQLDLYAALAGVGATLLFIPLQISLAKRFAKLRGLTARSTDHRVRYISEVIDGIGSVKAYGWEKPFFSLIGQYRAEECNHIDHSQQLRAVNQALYYCSSPISSFITFLVFWATGNTLTLPEVFSTMALLQTLRMTVGRFWTRGIETGSEAIESCKRIEEFIDIVDKQQMKLKEQELLFSSEFGIDESGLQDGIELGEHKTFDTFLSQCVLKINKSSYYYGDDPSKVTLSDIELEVYRGELVMIVGPVGAGKSSFLSAVLDEIKQVNPVEQSRFIHPQTRIAYCAQRPWILAASVRSNITLAGVNSNPLNDFKHPVDIDEILYKKSVESCRIVDDMIQWPTYDDTEVGERGISISGGQKARIALARAVYSDSDLILLDDPLSAVDAHVGKALFHDCIINAMKESNKAILLVTHQLQYLKYASKVVVLNEYGRQTFYGSYADLISKANQFEYLDLEGEINLADEKIESKDVVIKPSSIYNPELRFNYNQSVNQINKSNGKIPQDKSMRIELDKLSKQESKRIIIQAEDRIEGKMSFDLFYKYLQSGGLLSGCFALFLAVLSQGLLMITEYWLRWWASDTFGSQRSNKYIIVLAVLTSLCVFMGFYRASAWFKFTLKASSTLHQKCLWAVLYSPLQFFIANPTGRILNRFSRDTNQADELLPFTLFDFIFCTLLCLSSILLICISIPWLILMLPLLLYCFYIARKKYIFSAREIKRIDAITRSPIYADFSATLEGLVTLRAYKLRQSFTNVFQKQVDDNGKAYFSFLLVSRWLGFRLDGLCSILLIAVSILCVVLRHTIDVGLIGFALVYTMSLSGLFQWTVRQSAEVEAQMTAVERLETYSTLKPEDGYASTLESFSNKIELKPTNINFNLDEIKGEVNITDLSVTYREDLDPVLQNISICIPAGKKVGICGRTGSGKSSTLLALLRLNIIISGDIIIDKKFSLLNLSLEEARSCLSLIPQDPHLFSGTVRFNLDPFSKYTDDNIWLALKDAHIYEYISNDPLGLSAVVDEGGKNFSVGQRQLLSLARAILRKSKIILMDEVTASIDYQTDKLIQKTIRSSNTLKNSTIITVAHRLRTIADSDIIVVVDKGNVVENGSPSELLDNEYSEFYRLAIESNEFDDIRNIANKLVNVTSINEKLENMG